MGERLTGLYQKTLDKNYLGHWDVPEDGDLVLTIDGFEKNEIMNNKGGKEKKHICFFKEPGYKPMVCNKTNIKTIAAVVGSDKFEDWEGKKIAIYAANVPQSESGKGLRVRPYAPRVEEFTCEHCGQIITDHTDGEKTFKARAIAENARTKFGRVLCWDCAIEAKEASE